MTNVKRYAGAAVAAAIVIALLLHGKRTQPAVVQFDPAPRTFQRATHRALAQQIVVYVAGSVARPGLYHLAAGSRGIDAVHAAGGLTAQADPAGVNLAEQLEDGEQITAARFGERARVRGSHPRGTRHRRHKRSALTAVVAPVDLNSADAQVLMQLPGIGEELANRIIAFREANGPFASVDELADVAGVTPRTLDAITPYLTLTR